MRLSTSFQRLLQGYYRFREKYAYGQKSIMKKLANSGQNPEIMIVACCDSRVDPALILQCDPGDLFIVRNVANLIPPYETNHGFHGVSAALEFGINFLKVKNLIIWGHSQCGGIQALLHLPELKNTDFLAKWLSISPLPSDKKYSMNQAAKESLRLSYEHCLEYPWITEKIAVGALRIDLWFFDISKGKISSFDFQKKKYYLLKKSK